MHPKTTAPLGIKISIMSLDDERLAKIKRNFQDERTRLESKGKYLKAIDVEENKIELIFAAMTGWTWEGEANWHGEKPAFSAAKVKEILNAAPWMRTQLENELGEVERFFVA